MRQYAQVVARQACRTLGWTELARGLDDLAVIRELKRRFMLRALLDPTLNKQDLQHEL